MTAAPARNRPLAACRNVSVEPTAASFWAPRIARALGTRRPRVAADRRSVSLKYCNRCGHGSFGTFTASLFQQGGQTNGGRLIGSRGTPMLRTIRGHPHFATQPQGTSLCLVAGCALVHPPYTGSFPRSAWGCSLRCSVSATAWVVIRRRRAYGTAFPRGTVGTRACTDGAEFGEESRKFFTSRLIRPTLLLTRSCGARPGVWQGPGAVILERFVKSGGSSTGSYRVKGAPAERPGAVHRCTSARSQPR